MATVAELKAVLKDTLEKRGALGQIKARIRAEVFNALDDQSEPRPPLSHENLLINELIREYLEYNKYKYAASVLTAGLPAALSQIIPLVCKKTYPLLLILKVNALTKQLMQEQENLLAACKIKIPFLKYLLLFWKMANHIFKAFITFFFFSLAFG
ncbi:centrosomal protein 20 isoform X4 [Strix uralensis]|uniref:centrosomal protein 20 isoform X4 n=1 Tax=Strix uralensis TaxID=36305 RepID=UPI003DA66A7B